MSDRQLSLRLEVPAQSHSITSIEAARSMEGHAPTLRNRVLFLLRVAALTDEGICDALNLSPSTARPRRVELVQMGLVVAVGRMRGRSGRFMTLWEAKEE